VTGVLAFLTQYDSELGGTALAIVIVGFGAVQLIAGRSPDFGRLRPRTVRVLGAVQILVGLGFGSASFTLHREEDWGGAPQLTVLAAWLAAVATIAVVHLRKYRAAKP
jgi:hypothetical protein